MQVWSKSITGPLDSAQKMADCADSEMAEFYSLYGIVTLTISKGHKI